MTSPFKITFTVGRNTRHFVRFHESAADALAWFNDHAEGLRTTYKWAVKLVSVEPTSDPRTA